MSESSHHLLLPVDEFVIPVTTFKSHLFWFDKIHCSLPKLNLTWEYYFYPSELISVAQTGIT
jgi:hypothetical protein